MAAWLIGLVWLALTDNPVALQNADLSWVPPPTAGMRAPALAPVATDRQLVRKPWCDFGRHAQRAGKGTNAADVVFRRPSAQSRTALNAIREAIQNPDDYKATGAAQARFEQLAQTIDGPGLLRITFQDTDARVQLMTLKATRLVVARQPRLVAFATAYLGATDPQMAIAAMEAHFASGCDTAAQYGLDGFRHPDEGVQLATLKQVFEVTRQRENLRLIDRIADLVAQGVGTPRARVIALRLVGRLDDEAASAAVESLLKDKNDAVAAEAFATLAILQPGLAEKRLGKWLKDKSPLKRAAALRAFAQVHANRRDLAEKVLRPLLADPTPIPETLGVAAAPGKTLGAVAQAALNYIEML